MRHLEGNEHRKQCFSKLQKSNVLLNGLAEGMASEVTNFKMRFFLNYSAGNAEAKATLLVDNCEFGMKDGEAKVSSALGNFTLLGWCLGWDFPVQKFHENQQNVGICFFVPRAFQPNLSQITVQFGRICPVSFAKFHIAVVIFEDFWYQKTSSKNTGSCWFFLPTAHSSYYY